MVPAMLKQIPVILAFLALLAPPALAIQSAEVAATELRQQRDDFLAAERALRTGDRKTFEALRAGLHAYPLYPYLHYEDLGSRLARASAAEITDFVARNGDTPLAALLQRRWLGMLARNGRWETLLEHFPASTEGMGTELECHRRRALLETGRADAALEGVVGLWLVGHSQPAACDPVFNAWRDRGGLDSGLAWQRFRLAMKAGEIRLARYLVRYMDAERGGWAELWLRVHGSPRLLDTRHREVAALPVRSDIFAHGVRRIARADIEAALGTWERIARESPGLSADDRVEIERSLAITLAVRGHPQALERLLALEDAPADDAVREWRVRAPLAREEWKDVLASIERMDENGREAPAWRYWRARALEALGQPTLAEEQFLSLAESRGYYGFLAADRLERPYALGHAPLSAEDAGAVDPAVYPGIARARELRALGREVDARREWYHATRDMSEWQLISAAALARDWGWHDRAIITLARTGPHDDLELRFPLAHQASILAHARAHGIDPALAFAVVRQESAFAADARSPAGALGLMQLLPSTARQVAARLDLPFGGRPALLDIETNLRIGMAYLRQLLDRYGHQIPALAAYNAGPHRVDTWLPVDRMVDADVWAEVIPFRETRNYVQNVMYFAAIYERRLGNGTDGRLADRMPVVVPKDARFTRKAADAEEDGASS